MSNKLTDIDIRQWSLIPGPVQCYQSHFKEHLFIPYSLPHWIYRVSILCKPCPVKKQTEPSTSIDPAVERFALAYAAATFDISDLEYVDITDPKNYEDFHNEIYSRFIERDIVFSRERGPKGQLQPPVYIPRGSEFNEYLNNGGVSKIPNTEEGFIKIAVGYLGSNAAQMAEYYRKEYRLIRDLRLSYKELIRSVGTSIKEAGNKDKAEQLYKDFYNYTALEWLIELPY